MWSSLPCLLVLEHHKVQFRAPLFLIYIDDISKVRLSERSQVVLYADDMLLYHPISNSDDYSTLKSDINWISNWTSAKGMSFNISSASAWQSLGNEIPSSSVSCLALDGSLPQEVPMFKCYHTILRFVLVSHPGCMKLIRPWNYRSVIQMSLTKL